MYQVIINNLFFNIAMVFFSIVLLWKGAEWLVDAASKLAQKLGVSDLVIGLTIVAIGTSAPEFAVSVSAALEGNPEIAVGNVFGSNIFNLGFILGLGVLFKNLKTTRNTVYRDGTFLVCVALLIYFLMFGFDFNILSGGYLSPNASVFLVVLLVGYIFFLYMKKPDIESGIPSGDFRIKDFFWLIIGITFVIIGGYLLVENAVKIGTHAGLDVWIIGITIVAAGTSSPELVTTLVSIVKKKYNMAIGNLIGSDLFNMLGVIGVAGIVGKGIQIPAVAHISLLILIANLMVIVFFLIFSWKLVQWEGIILVLISMVRYYIDFIVVGR